jgi:hypothetical protein
MCPLASFELAGFFFSANVEKNKKDLDGKYQTGEGGKALWKWLM